MYIIINYQSGEPIYEQIKSQIRAQILACTPPAGSALPSIRTLAKELKVGIITAKRAYDDLCGEGLLYSVQGKGVFVAEMKSDETDLYKRKRVSEKLDEAVKTARECGVGDGELIEILNELLNKGGR